MRNPKWGRTKINKHSSSHRHHRTGFLTGGRKQYMLHGGSKSRGQWLPHLFHQVLKNVLTIDFHMQYT